MEIIGYLCLFLPGIISFTLFCKLKRLRRYSRALLIMLASILLGILGGFIFEPIYADLHGPAPGNDPSYHMAYIMGLLQIPVGLLIGLFSLVVPVPASEETSSARLHR